MGRPGNRWEHSFKAYDSWSARQTRPAPETSGEAQRRCARGQWCPGSVAVGSGAAREILGAPTYRPYCDSCSDHIGRCLGEMPRLYRDLWAEIGEPAMGELLVRMPFGPSLPLRADIDALMRVTAVILAGWEARVCTIARLVMPDPQRDLLSVESVTNAAETLSKQIDVLLALQPSWMSRSRSLAPGRHGKPAVITEEIETLYADVEIVRIGADFLTVMEEADGTRAGQEILHLHHRARRTLKETRPKPEDLDLVQCRECEHRTLRRADPPWHKGEQEYHSICANPLCGDRMTVEEYEQNAKRWLAYHRARAATPVLEAPQAA